MSDEKVFCEVCGSSDLELYDETMEKTGDGSDVLARHYDCHGCGRAFIVNELVRQADNGSALNK